MRFQEFFQNGILWGNTLAQWMESLVAGLVCLGLLWVIRNIVGARLRNLALKTTNDLDDFIADLIQGTRKLFFLSVAIWVAARWLELPEGVLRGVRILVVTGLFLQGCLWAGMLVKYLVSHYVRLDGDQESAAGSAAAITFIGKLVVWSVLLLLALENVGVDVTALVASLGIGGIAIALASQNILGDLFASLSILLDKPFLVGDNIAVDDKVGKVEKIGLKTTRVRSVSGEELIFSNNDLLQSRVRNLKRMEERRVLFAIGVTYQTPADQLRGIPGMLKEIIEKESRVRFDRAHFKTFGDSSLLFEVVFWVLSPDILVYMDVQERINLEIFDRFEKEGIDFAYPTQTLFLEKS